MSDDPSDDRSPREELSERLEEGADRAVEEFDQRLVDLLSWLLDTETKARIFVYLRSNQDATSEEIAEGTGLYPSTVREALAELYEEDVVEREKRDSEGAGNNPYEYAAMAPSDLVGSAREQLQEQLNAVVNLDQYITGGTAPETEPVTITVEEENDTETTSETTETSKTADTDDTDTDTNSGNDNNTQSTDN